MTPIPSPRRAVDLSPRALLAAGVSGVLAADLAAAEAGRWSLATRAEDLAPSAVRVMRAGERGRVAIVSVLGPIDQRATWQPCEGMSDGYDTIEARFRAAVEVVKEGRGKVVLLVDSPGGDAAGMTAAVRRMIAVRDRAGVEVEAVAEERATSAAFALMLVGNRLHVPVRGRTASIGTVIVRHQVGGAEGVEVFRSGERKMRPNAIEPLNKEDREDLQSIVDDFALEFASLVAEYRGKTPEHWLSFKGASLSGKAALEAGLVDSNKNAHEVIEMALNDAARAEMAEAVGLSASASEAEIKARIQENRAAAAELAAVKAQLATVEADKLALEERQAREKAAQEAVQKRAVFAAEVERACSDGLITPPRVAGLLAHYDAHGEASARATFGLVKADKPLVPTAKVGAAPEVSSSATVLTPEQIAHAKALGVDPALYAAHMTGGAKGGV